MKLWLLTPKKKLPKKNNPWEPWYDKAFGFVIRAETEKEARELANKNGGDEKRDNPWLNKKLSKCVELKANGKEDVIIKDIRWA